MKKYFIRFIAGLFGATYGVEGVVTLIKNLTGIAKEQVDDVMDIEK